MRTIGSLLSLALLCVACATTPAATPTAAPAPAPAPTAAKPAEVPASALVDRTGDSPETAVEVPADAPNSGVDFENNWIYDRYGRFRRQGGGTGVSNNRRYNVVKIELPDGSTKTVYFDITENWKKWTPSDHP